MRGASLAFLGLSVAVVIRDPENGLFKDTVNCNCDCCSTALRVGHEIPPDGRTTIKCIPVENDSNFTTACPWLESASQACETTALTTPPPAPPVPEGGEDSTSDSSEVMGEMLTDAGVIGNFLQKDEEEEEEEEDEYPTVEETFTMFCLQYCRPLVDEKVMEQCVAVPTEMAQEAAMSDTASDPMWMSKQRYDALAATHAANAGQAANPALYIKAPAKALAINKELSEIFDDSKQMLNNEGQAVAARKLAEEVVWSKATEAA